MPCKGLLERLKDGETVIIAEGYVFAFERRGYLQAGVFVPEVVLEHPHLVKAMYEEFVHAGSDVVIALTYYGHKEKLRHANKEAAFEQLNRTALKLARQVADETNTLMAGNLCNSCLYDPNNPASIDQTRMMFQEQVKWAAEEGADFIVMETSKILGESLVALETIKSFGLPAVVTMVPKPMGPPHMTMDGYEICDAMKQLEDAGAAVVGLNCIWGPESMIPILKKIKTVCSGPIAAVPVPYRTDHDHKTFFTLNDSTTGKMAFPDNLDPYLCSRNQIVEFGRQCQELGIQYVGLCCGNSAAMTRTLAETLGRKPPASRYSKDMTRHYIFGDDNIIPKHNAPLRNLLKRQN